MSRKSLHWCPCFCLGVDLHGSQALVGAEAAHDHDATLEVHASASVAPPEVESAEGVEVSELYCKVVRCCAMLLSA